MSVSSDKTADQSRAANPYPGAPVVKDVWTVSGGDYTPLFKIKGAKLTKGADTTAVLKYKLRLDDTADAETFTTNVIHPIGDAISATKIGTTATTVTFFG